MPNLIHIFGDVPLAAAPAFTGGEHGAFIIVSLTSDGRSKLNLIDFQEEFPSESPNFFLVDDSFLPGVTVSPWDGTLFTYDEIRVEPTAPSTGTGGESTSTIVSIVTSGHYKSHLQLDEDLFPTPAAPFGLVDDIKQLDDTTRIPWRMHIFLGGDVGARVMPFDDEVYTQPQQIVSQRFNSLIVHDESRVEFVEPPVTIGGESGLVIITLIASGRYNQHPLIQEDLFPTPATPFGLVDEEYSPESQRVNSNISLFGFQSVCIAAEVGTIEVNEDYNVPIGSTRIPWRMYVFLGGDIGARVMPFDDEVDHRPASMVLTTYKSIETHAVEEFRFTAFFLNHDEFIPGTEVITWNSVVFTEDIVRIAPPDFGREIEIDFKLNTKVVDYWNPVVFSYDEIKAFPPLRLDEYLFTPGTQRITWNPVVFDIYDERVNGIRFESQDEHREYVQRITWNPVVFAFEEIKAYPPLTAVEQQDEYRDTPYRVVWNPVAFVFEEIKGFFTNIDQQDDYKGPTQTQTIVWKPVLFVQVDDRVNQPVFDIGGEFKFDVRWDIARPSAPPIDLNDPIRVIALDDAYEHRTATTNVRWLASTLIDDSIVVQVGLDEALELKTDRTRITWSAKVFEDLVDVPNGKNFFLDSQEDVAPFMAIADWYKASRAAMETTFYESLDHRHILFINIKGPKDVSFINILDVTIQGVFDISLKSIQDYEE